MLAEKICKVADRARADEPDRGGEKAWWQDRCGNTLIPGTAGALRGGIGIAHFV